MLGATRLVHWLCQLLLLSPALNLRLPRVPAPPVRLAAATSRTRSLVLLAKKKKGKGPKEAAAALAALDAWDATQAPGLVGEVDDPLAPVQAVTKKPKKPKKGKAVAAEDLDAPPLVAPLPVEGGAAAAPMTTEASPPPPAAPAVTMADKVARIKLELGLDEALPLAAAVKAANEAMGLEPGGSMAEQVATLIEQLGIVMDPATAAPAPSPAPSPAPPAGAGAPTGTSAGVSRALLPASPVSAIRACRCRASV